MEREPENMAQSHDDCLVFLGSIFKIVSPQCPGLNETATHS